MDGGAHIIKKKKKKKEMRKKRSYVLSLYVYGITAAISTNHEKKYS